MITDEYVIARFMESRPAWNPPRPNSAATEWWEWSYADCPWGEWRPKEMTLDRLWLVEEKLTQDQAVGLDKLLKESADHEPHNFVWHASAEQKAKALAVVIR